jgi:predicted nuclease of predicted toxin-antitoxin system
VARWQRQQDHDVFSVYEQARGMEDDQIIQKAFDENWVLITNDKDFGEKVYRERYPHKGVVLLRLENERTASKIHALQTLLRDHSERIPESFVVVTETRVRFARG